MVRKLAASVSDEAETDETRTVQASRQRRRVRRPGRLRLWLLDGAGAGSEVGADRSRARVGRSRTADIVVDHPSLSALHFELRITRHGIELFDLASKNGTSILGRRVFHAIVHPGDVIMAGDCRFELLGTGDISVEQALEAREDGLLGISDVMRETFALIDRAAVSELTVLIGGETGTGKELVARAIHRNSSRRSGPFVVLACSALPTTLAEPLILGHTKGSFTNASSDQSGVFETAHGGTLFLDEIGELPISVQPKLLRVLDRREVTRIGEHSPRPVDVRLVAATHRDLPRMVADGFFREDLYHRLAAMTIDLPSLRERGPAEIEYLAKCFLASVNARQHKRLEWSNDALEALESHTWPGNVRELLNITNRAAVFCTPPSIERNDLQLRPHVPQQIWLEHLLDGGGYPKLRDELDRHVIVKALEDSGGSVSEAARRLKVGRKFLTSRIAALGLRAMTRGEPD